MKRLLQIISILSLSGCFFSVGEFPPDFCEISESHMVINDDPEVGGRCGDGIVTYQYLQSEQQYMLKLESTDMVPAGNGSSQNVGLFLELYSSNPIESGDYLNSPGKSYQYSILWYDYQFYDLETQQVSLNISPDSIITANVRLSANITNFQFEAPEPATFEMTFRNLKLPNIP